MFKLTVVHNGKIKEFEGDSMVDCTEQLMTWLSELGDQAEGVAQRVLDNEPVVSLERAGDGWEVRANPVMAIWDTQKFDDLPAALTEFRGRLPFEGMWTEINQPSLWTDAV